MCLNIKESTKSKQPCKCPSNVEWKNNSNSWVYVPHRLNEILYIYLTLFVFCISVVFLMPSDNTTNSMGFIQASDVSYILTWEGHPFFMSSSLIQENYLFWRYCDVVNADICNLGCVFTANTSHNYHILQNLGTFFSTLMTLCNIRTQK